MDGIIPSIRRCFREAETRRRERSARNDEWPFRTRESSNDSISHRPVALWTPREFRSAESGANAILVSEIDSDERRTARPKPVPLEYFDDDAGRRVGLASTWRFAWVREFERSDDPC